MKVRKKPVVVDAWPVDELLNTHVGDLPTYVLDAYRAGLIDFEKDRITVITMEGTMSGWSGWYLMRGIEGEFYPCDGAIFEKTYDIVTDVITRTEPPHTLIGTPTPYDSNPEG